MSGHTPTPWAVADDTVIYYAGDDEEVVADFANHEVESLAEACIGHVGYLDVDAANAAHIVKCVNHHDELVAALDALVGTFRFLHPTNTEQVDNARALLEKVKP